MKRNIAKRISAIGLALVMALTVVQVSAPPEVAKAATVTAKGGYDPDSPIKKGMIKVIDDEYMTVKAEVLSYSTDFSSITATGTLTLKWSFTPKQDIHIRGLEIDGDSRFAGYDSVSNTALYDGSTEVKSSSPFNGFEGDLSSGKTYTAKPTYRFSTQAEGYRSIKLGSGMYIIGENDDGNYVDEIEFDFTFPLSIGKLSKSAYVKSATSKSITLNKANLGSLGRDVASVGVQYRKKGASSWKTNNGFTISGLKANTDYQIRVWYNKNITTSSGKTKLTSSPYSNAITVKTGLSDKPVIKSVKISKAKKKKKWHEPYGYWNSAGHWVYVKGYYSYYTTAKATISIKKKVKGAVGYCINIDGSHIYVSGKKTKWTENIVLDKNAIGKKVYVSAAAYNQSDHTGMSGYSKAKKTKVNK